MHRQPYDDREEARVWLSEGEVEQFLAGLTDTRQRIAFGLGLRCGLRPEEIVNAVPADLVDGPAGVMLRVETGSNEEQYRETPVPAGLTIGIRTIDDVREEPSTAPLVGVGSGTLGCWVDHQAEARAADTGDEGWRDLSPRDLRRTWAVLLVGVENMDPRLVCQWGGWEDLEAFREYYRGADSPTVQRQARESVEWL